MPVSTKPVAATGFSVPTFLSEKLATMVPPSTTVSPDSGVTVPSEASVAVVVASYTRLAATVPVAVRASGVMVAVNTGGS